MIRSWCALTIFIFLSACTDNGSYDESSKRGEFNGPFTKHILDMPDKSQRNYILRLPKGFNKDNATAVVFNFHGATSTAMEQFVYSNFNQLADDSNVILVMPDANKVFVDPSHELAEYWDSAWEANLRVRDYDIDFILALVEKLRLDYGTLEFFATGMSAGGDISSALACLPNSPFKAHATVTYRYYNDNECKLARPSPTLSFHGTNDWVVPIEGSDSPWNDPPVDEIMQRWAVHNQCDVEPQVEFITDEVSRIHWHNCTAATQWYRISGGGHTWPGAESVFILGRTNQDISASQLIWKFFGLTPNPG